MFPSPDPSCRPRRRDRDLRGQPETRDFGELLIDLEEDKAARTRRSSAPLRGHQTFTVWPSAPRPVAVSHTYRLPPLEDAPVGARARERRHRGETEGGAVGLPGGGGRGDRRVDRRT